MYAIFFKKIILYGNNGVFYGISFIWRVQGYIALSRLATKKQQPLILKSRTKKVSLREVGHQLVCQRARSGKLMALLVEVRIVMMVLVSLTREVSFPYHCVEPCYVHLSIRAQLFKASLA